MTTLTPEGDDRKPLSIARAADRLGISTATAHRRINDGTFPVRVVKIGSRRKVLPGDMDRYIDGVAADIKAIDIAS